LQESRALLLADPNYTEGEATSIFKTVYKKCADLVTGKGEAAGAKPFGFSVDTQEIRERLSIAEDEDLEHVASEYLRRSEAAQCVLQAHGFD
jgi:hypothetical protein